MQTVTITLSDDMKQVADEQVLARGFGSLSEYLQSLIALDGVKDPENLEQLILEGLEGPLTELDEAEWDAMEREALAIVEARRKTRNGS